MKNKKSFFVKRYNYNKNTFHTSAKNSAEGLGQTIIVLAVLGLCVAIIAIAVGIFQFAYIRYVVFVLYKCRCHHYILTRIFRICIIVI